MPVTIRDVAERAGTSVAAVSAVISVNRSHNIRIGHKTRARILEAAEQLGYKPNPLAKSLVTGKTGVLGLAFPYSRAFADNNPFTSCIMSGVFEEAVRERYNVMLHTAIGNDWNSADENALIDPRVDGLLLVIPAPNSPVIARCRQLHVPYVALVYAADDPDVFAVNAEEFVGGQIATEHLLSCGHRRIAHLVGNPAVATTEPRKCGYLAALEAAGVPVDEGLIVPAGFDYRDGVGATQQLLELPPDRRPTALFAANDLCADGALGAMRAAGIRVPEEMAVVGYDDTWFAAMTQPALTSVHMPIHEMGMLATQMLIAQVEGREVAQRQVTLPVTLSVRASTA
ncbi:MAG TPA: LacI family DNA-binding transcriptional regulator [Chthonomonadaceae bacterium]|nr:LacI family DNA-binding transcriptional regulator [Chthonomonadaceae bacterium]